MGVQEHGAAVGRGDHQGGGQLPGLGRADPGARGALARADQERGRARERRARPARRGQGERGSRPPADRVAEGEFDDQFPIDVFQTGSGTSSNMNANEVIATLAGDDVHRQRRREHGPVLQRRVPLRRASRRARHRHATTCCRCSSSSRRRSQRKADEFKDMVKSGRTHLMDAVPVTLGQEFSGYAAQVRLGARRISNALPQVAQIPLGGTATGTGLNTHKEFAARVRARLTEVDRPRDPRARGPVRGAGQPRRAGRAVGRAQGAGRLADQDRQRPRLAGLRAAGGDRRGVPARAPEGLLDHARQGQPGDPRGRAPGRARR